MIKNWLVRGDTHGNFNWMMNGCLNDYEPEETAIIILGDAGFDFYLNKTDERKKKEVDARGYYIYWLRGNHEARPRNVKGYEVMFDVNVHGAVYCDPRYPHLRAFMDFGFYDINNYTCLIIGGAYSVDKYWRLQRAGMTEETNDPKKTGWFADEQMTRYEMEYCHAMIKAFAGNQKKIDFVMTHTCPLSVQPTDLFLSQVDQSTVDNLMEQWLDMVRSCYNWYIWLFGHYHKDRIERPRIEQFYNDIEDLDDIYNRWITYDEIGELDWWIEKFPNFDMV